MELRITPRRGWRWPKTRLAKSRHANLHIASGEVYDFESQLETAGEIAVEVARAFQRCKS